MKNEFWRIIFEKAVNNVDGIGESNKEKVIKAIIKDTLVDLPTSEAKKGPDLSSNESKQIGKVIAQEISKSLQSQAGFPHKEDWCKKVSNDVKRVLSSEPWWINKKNRN